MPRQENRLAAVRALSEGLLGVLVPEEVSEFDRKFGFWAANPVALAVREQQVGELAYSPRNLLSKNLTLSPTATPQGLDTTLVAGMFLQVILEAEHLPRNSLERTSFIKKAVKNFLVQRLAGQITLSQFFRLVQIIEREVMYYFHRLQGEWLAPQENSMPRPELASTVTNGIAPPAPVHIPDLKSALNRLPLPHQGNRKMSPEGLLGFLLQSEGRWFRLLDFEAQFCLNKKTAWTYLTLLLQHDILRHNDGKANKVRYSLSPKFMAPEK